MTDPVAAVASRSDGTLSNYEYGPYGSIRRPRLGRGIDGREDYVRSAEGLRPIPAGPSPLNQLNQRIETDYDLLPRLTSPLDSGAAAVRDRLRKTSRVAVVGQLKFPIRRPFSGRLERFIAGPVSDVDYFHQAIELG